MTGWDCACLIQPAFCDVSGMRVSINADPQTVARCARTIDVEIPRWYSKLEAMRS